MRLCYVVVMAVATFLANSEAVLTAGHPAISITTAKTANQARQRHLRSYSMDDLESEDEERFQVKLSKSEVEKVAQRLQPQVQARTFNVDATLRAFGREHELQQITAYFASHNGALGGWLERSTLDSLRGANLEHLRSVFTQWKTDGRTLENLTALLNANSVVEKEYRLVTTMYGGFLQLARRTT